VYGFGIIVGIILQSAPCANSHDGVGFMNQGGGFTFKSLEYCVEGLGLGAWISDYCWRHYLERPIWVEFIWGIALSIKGLGFAFKEVMSTSRYRGTAPELRDKVGFKV
jgi:hypothetical protein